ncbi:MAG: hypothetical protein AB1297_03580 [bacterium]
MKRLFLLLSFTIIGYAEEYPFLFGLDMEQGAINIASLYNLTNRACDFGISRNIIARSGKMVVFDIPLSLWTTTIHHEYFGHGIRARELGLSASYYIPFPWEYVLWWNLKKVKRAYCSVWGYPSDIEKRLQMSVSGIEANQLLAHKIQRQFYKKENIHYYEALLFFHNKLYVNSYIYHTPNPNSSEDDFRKELSEGGDIATYLVRMDEKEAKSDYKENYTKLKREAMWNLADPSLWMAAYFLGRYLAFGEKDFKMPRFKGIGMGTRFNLTPMGEEFYLDIYQKTKYFYLRKGEGFYGAGIGIDGSFLSGRIDLWRQSNKEGYHLNASFTKGMTNWIEFIIEAGLKTEGYLMGKGFKESRYGAIGLGLSF